MPTTIWHNPRCSKSRQTLALLEEKGILPEVVLYLENPPSVEEIDTVLKMLGRTPRELMRAKEKAYQEAGLDNPDLTREQLIAAMAANPSVIERPLVIKNGKAAIGRPPEDILKIL
jgi:arsenate reductase